MPTATPITVTINTDGVLKTLFESPDNFGAAFINYLAKQVYEENATWYRTKTGRRKKMNIGLLIALTHSELSEALEGFRKELQDDKLPHRKMLEVELADAVLRILGIAEICRLDLGGAIMEKRRYNLTRADHTVAERNKKHGKKF